MNSCLCVLPEPSAMLLESEMPRRSQLLGVAVKSPSVKLVGDSMEFNCQIGGCAPDFKVLKTPVWSPRLTSSPLRLYLRAFLFAIELRVISHNFAVNVLSSLNGKARSGKCKESIASPFRP
jgi:hypothetical protein